jgi:hypothetical protein
MKSLLLLVLAFFATQLCYAQWQYNGNDISNTNSGNVTVGPLTNNASFNVYKNTGVGSNPGNFTLITSFGGLAGTGNLYWRNTWLLRNAVGSGWDTINLHDGISVDISFQTPHVDSRVWWERDPGANIQSWGDQSSTYFTIYKGLVGVGTSKPVSLFQVATGQAKTSIGDLGGSGATLLYGTSYLGFNAARNGTNWTINQDGANNGASILFSTILGDICLATIPTTGASDRLLTDNDVASNVKFRITSDGTVLAKTIKVQTNIFPDYVFKPGYLLPRLSQVQTYIDQNHRLPEMPSEDEVVKAGINLGEMVKLQTKKIEELTLYLIEKDKQISDLNKKVAQVNGQQAEIAEQKNEIKELREKVDRLIAASKK